MQEHRQETQKIGTGTESRRWTRLETQVHRFERIGMNKDRGRCVELDAREVVK